VIKPFEQALYGDKNLTQDELQKVYDAFGFSHVPLLRLQVAEPTFDAKGKDLHVSPLQMALASAALSDHGIIPAPRIATAINTPTEGWLVLPALGRPFEALPASAADAAGESLIREGEIYWEQTGQAEREESPVTWFLGGTSPDWQASPLVVVVLLEDQAPRLAQRIGEELLTEAMNP
jgi:hypothetical protein